jgi:magnesium-transporting ATPase (P-type)
VRVRRGPEKDAGVATAMVVRTGFNTTKGALIRSMLFPRPNKFRFYRDSFRFIGVMAVIAMMGFCVSIVNFVKLGVRCLLCCFNFPRLYFPVFLYFLDTFNPPSFHFICLLLSDLDSS